MNIVEPRPTRSALFLLAANMNAEKVELATGWERSETTEGIPYYIEHDKQRTHWKHPLLQDLVKEFESFDKIKYGAYRTASKLRALQITTNMHMVSGKWLSMVLNEMGLQDKFNTSLFVAEVEVLISKLFSRVTDNICIEESVELTLNWALNCYDNGRTGRVLLRSLATGIIILSALTPLEKYDGLYKIITSTENETISEDNLSTLLLDILMLIEFVSEEKVYSSEDIPGAVLSCKQLLNTEIINEAGFINWAKREPQILTWLSTFHRLVTSESIKHEAKCAVCKMCPIVGFRYRCQKCFNIDICQNCYWLQCGTKTHKITHPVKEYCLATTSSDDMKDFASQLRNKITRRYHRHKPKKPYLSSAEFLQDKTNVKSNKQIHDRIATLASKLSNEEVEKPLIIPTKNEISSHEDVKKIQQIEAEKEQYLKKIADLQAENRILSEEATHAKFITPITVHHHAEAAPTSVASVTSDTGAYKSSLPASTAATCISLTGLSASTLDDWPFTQGNEEENLQQMTTQLVNIIAEPTLRQSNTEVNLYKNAIQVNLAMQELIEEVENCLFK